MAGRLFASRVCHSIPIQSRGITYQIAMERVGKREIVGFGHNGDPAYIDRTDFPMPAVRFMEDNPQIMALREKEKGDWKKLSLEEKKSLYRASFCQTFSEIEAPTGEIKGCIAVALMGVTLGLWLYMFMKAFVYPPLPETFDREHQLAQLKRMQLLDINAVTGITGKK